MKQVFQLLYNLIQTWKSLKGHSTQNIHLLSNKEKFQQNKSIYFLKNLKNQLFYCSVLRFITVGSNPEDLRNENETEEWKREKHLSKHITQAEIYIKNGDLKKAEDILYKALIANNKHNTAGITVVYDMLATLANNQKFPIRAVTILEKGIEDLTANGFSSEHNTIVDFRLKLARLNSKLVDNKEAERNFRKCLEIQKVKYVNGIRDEETVKLWVNSLFWFAKHLMSNGHYLEAKQCFDTAYTLCAQVKSIQDDQVMVILYNLAEVSYKTGDKDGALRHLISAVIFGRNSNSPDLPIYYNRIGIIYMSKGIFNEAKKWCEASKEKSQKLHNKAAQAEAEECIKKVEEMLKSSPLKKV